MKLTLDDLGKDNLISDLRVAIVAGQHNLINNIVSDRIKAACRDSFELDKESLGELYDEFSIEDTEYSEEEGLYVLNLETFVTQSTVPPPAGLWFCRVDIDVSTAAQRDLVLKYIERPNEYGKLVVVSSDYKVFRVYLRNRTLLKSGTCHIFNVGFPNKTQLRPIIENLAAEYKIEFSTKALDNFIIRMSDQYDSYPMALERLSRNLPENDGEMRRVGPDALAKILKGIEFFSINDFVEALSKPLSSGTLNNKKITRMLFSLLDAWGGKALVRKLLKSIDQCIDFRLMVNKGIIPVGVEFFYADTLKRLPDTSEYKEWPEWKFRNAAQLAIRTSLRDWLYIKLILGRIRLDGKIQSSDEEIFRMLYGVCIRSVMCEDRLNNIIGADDILEHPINRIDRVRYKEETDG